jgi:hypothetical protein
LPIWTVDRRDQVLDGFGVAGGVPRQGPDVAGHDGEAASRPRPARAASTAPLVASMVVWTAISASPSTSLAVAPLSSSSASTSIQHGAVLGRGRLDVLDQRQDRLAAFLQQAAHRLPARVALWRHWRWTERAARSISVMAALACCVAAAWI